MGIHGLCMDSLLQKQSPGQWIKNKKPLQSQILSLAYVFPNDWRFLQFPDTPSKSAFRCCRTTACIPGVREKDLIDGSSNSVSSSTFSSSKSVVSRKLRNLYIETSYWTCNKSRTLGQVLFAFQQVPPQCLKLKMRASNLCSLWLAIDPNA